MEDNQAINDNAKKYKMTLLFTQTKYLYDLYNKNMELSPEIYFLVDKKWLDDYKQRNEYNKIVQKLINSPGYNNYHMDKIKIKNEFGVDKNKDDFTTIDVGDQIKNFFALAKKNLEDYQINVPKNFELVLSNFFSDCLNNSSQLGFPKTDVYLGNQTILIVDEEKNEVLYCCSLVKNEENNFNFCVKVDYILFFEDPDCQRDQIDKIADVKGLDNYLLMQKIDKNKKGEQDIRDKNGRTIGKFLKFDDEEDEIFHNDISSINININPNMQNPSNVINPNDKTDLNPTYNFAENQIKEDETKR